MRLWPRRSNQNPSTNSTLPLSNNNNSSDDGGVTPLNPVAAAALLYSQRGIAIVPVHYQSKAPINDWKVKTYSPEFFRHQQWNIGGLLGPKSDGLTDGDHDCKEAAALARYFLPPSNARFGRASSRDSHWLYRSNLHESERRADIKYKDPTDQTVMGELRIGGGGNAAQTVLPPSIHKDTGEVIEFEPGCGIEGVPRVDGAQLKQDYEKLMAATLLARHWPDQGGRHPAALIIDGLLTRLQWSRDDRQRFIEAVATVAGDDEVKDRVAVCLQTEHKQADGRPVPGFKALSDAFGRPIAKKIAEWLRYPSSDKQQQQVEYEFHLLHGAELIPKKQEWLWPGRIPYGTLTMLIGITAVGKSHLYLDICARVTTGDRMPLSHEPRLDRRRRVLIVCTEDRVEHTLVPRLMAARADMSQVMFLRHLKGADGNTRSLDLTQDMPRIKQCLDDYPDIGLIVLDPITENMGSKIDSHNNTATRAVLGPLMDLLDQRNVAALGITHMPKTKVGSVQTAAIGSVSFSAAPRSSLLALDEEEEVVDDDGDATGERELTGRKLLATNIGNLAPPEDKVTLVWELMSVTLPAPHDDISIARVEWIGMKEVSAHELWQGGSKKQGPSKQYAAIKFIKQAMREPDQPDQFRHRLSEEMEAEAAAAGISKSTLRRAKEELNIKSEVLPGTTGWSWIVPEDWRIKY